MTRMTRNILTCLMIVALTVLAARAPAQNGPPSRHRARLDAAQRERRDHFVEEVVAELKKSAGDALSREKLARFEWMARSVVRRLRPQEFRALDKLPLEEKVKKVASLWQKSRNRDLEEFIRRQPPAVAEELRTLKGRAREKRIAELKILHTLESTLEAAEKHGLLDAGEADRLRSLPSKEMLKESWRLKREIFFAIHGEEISAEERRRLEGLDRHQFWRDRTVRRFQILQQIDVEELERLRKLDSKSRRRLLEALRRGRGLESFVERGVLSAATMKRWTTLKADERRRLLRDLIRVHLPRISRGLRPSRRQMMEMNPGERRRFFMMNPEERLAFLRERFPNENWDEKARRMEDWRAVEESLRGMDRRQRSQLRGTMPSLAEARLKRLFPNQPDRVKTLMAAMKKVDWFRNVLPRYRELAGQLKPEERRKLKTMSTSERVDFLFARFGKTLDQDARRVLRRAGKELPPAWKDMTGSQKVLYLNTHNLTMPWPARHAPGPEPRPQRLRRLRHGSSR